MADPRIACIADYDNGAAFSTYLQKGLTLLEHINRTHYPNKGHVFRGHVAGNMLELALDERLVQLETGPLDTDPLIIVPRVAGFKAPYDAVQATLYSWIASSERALLIGSNDAICLQTKAHEAANLILCAQLEKGIDAERVTIEYTETNNWRAFTTTRSVARLAKPGLAAVNAWLRKRLQPMRRLAVEGKIWYGSGVSAVARAELDKPFESIATTTQIDDELMRAVSAY